MDSGVDVPSDGSADRSLAHGPVASVCAECGPDELGVGYYDGLCTPMGVGCNQVSPETRTAILVDHARCFFNALDDEICGKRNDASFWGCGEPSCGAKETFVSDLKCYGP